MLSVVSLNAVGKEDLARAGGKGANLGELLRGGFPVPPGFVVTTASYDEFVAANDLKETITTALREKQGSGEAIRAAFVRAPIPPTIEEAILVAYQELGQGAVAVRSSATAEDLPQAAFAGQQDTFLNIVDAEMLLDAVRRCWASLWTDRAIAYRERQGVDQETVKLAVVVQRMVDATFAGVMFTANPVSGARDEMVIDASPGLGEAVVSGLVTPDHFLLQKSKGRWTIRERRQGQREVIIRAQADGGTESVEGSVADNPPLPDEALFELARLGTSIQQHFGQPQDIEWVWTGEKCFIVQARPITTLPEPPPRANRLVRTLASLFAEMFPIRPYPLDQTAWLPALSAGVLEPMFSLIGVRVSSVDEMMLEEEGVVTRFSGKINARPTPALLLLPVRLWQMSRRYPPALWRDDSLAQEAEGRVRAMEAQNMQELSWLELLALVDEALLLPLPLAGEIRRRYLPGTLLAAAALRVMLSLLGQGGRFATLMSGVETMTLEANRALEALAAKVRSDSTLSAVFAAHDGAELPDALQQSQAGRAFLAELQAFLNRYGHREMVLSTVTQPTWRDGPDVVLGIIKGLAHTEPRPETGQPAWEMARDDVLGHPLLRLSPLRAAFRGVLSNARYLWQIRENTHYNATRILPLLRRLLLELGQRLVDAGVLNSSVDVFHLKLDELREIDGVWPPSPARSEKLEALVQQRKVRRASLEGIPLIDPRLIQQGDAANELSADLLLRGTAGSPGIAEGPVRVIREATEFGKLRAGEVLVAPYTNPSWTPLFQRAVAVIVDAGGPGSHAAIVAREYGIPAVMGTIDGTRTLVDGQRVRVDGNRGLVFRV